MEIRYRIDKADVGRKIGDFLKQQGYSKRNILALKRYPEKILVNGKWEFVNYILKAEDELVIRLTEEISSVRIEPQDIPLDIVYEDEDILVVNKPPFMPIHPTVNHETNTLANAVVYYYQKQGQEHIFRCMNRLDTNTSGLTIMAKHKYSGAKLGDAMRNREIHREYCAIVWGEDLPDEGCINMPIGKKEGSVIERMVREDGLEAITHYRVLERKNGLAYVRLKLETGRTHQIRVHMKAIGHPLIGDDLYAPEYMLMDRQALHSAKLVFPHPMTGQEMTLECPIPNDMLQIMIQGQKKSDGINYNHIV